MLSRLLCNTPGMSGLDAVYTVLFDAYGEQGWWPVPYRASTSGYGPKGYRLPGYKAVLNEEDRFSIVLGSVLTQNTNWNNAERALLNLHNAGISLPGDLSRHSLSEIEILIRPSGYFRQKAVRILRVAEAIAPYLAGGERPPARDFLLSINGVGYETADSILLYAFSIPLFIADLYTRRFLSRLAGEKKLGDYEGVRKEFERVLPSSAEVYGEYHALIVEHGKQHCGVRCSCDSCPCSSFCKGAGFC